MGTLLSSLRGAVELDGRSQESRMMMGYCRQVTEVLPYDTLFHFSPVASSPPLSSIVAEYPADNLQVELLAKVKYVERRGRKEGGGVVSGSAWLLRGLIDCSHPYHILNFWLGRRAQASPVSGGHSALSFLSNRPQHPPAAVLRSGGERSVVNGFVNVE